MDKRISFPSDWKIIKLGTIAKKCNNKNTGLVLSIVLTNSARHGVIPQTEHFEKEIAVEGNIDGYYIVNDGDFVYNPRISAMAPCGPIRRNKVGQTGVMSPLYTIFKLIDNTVSYDYVEYFFLSSLWHKYMKSIANYGARHDRMSISNAEFFSMPIPLPPLPEQQAIAEILRIADKDIELREQLITAKQQQKRWLMQNLLTGKVRLSGYNSEWAHTKLGDISNKCNNKNAGFIFSSVLTNSARHGVIPQTEHFDKDIAVEENIDGYYIVNDGDFVYNPRISVSAPCGPIRRNNTGGTGVMSPLYTVFKITSEAISHDFIEHYFLSSAWYKYMKSVANYGARHDRMSISNSDFFSMPIPVPPQQEQDAIVERLTVADCEIELYKQQLFQKRQIKKHLMQQLLSGRTRVKGA